MMRISERARPIRPPLGYKMRKRPPSRAVLKRRMNAERAGQTRSAQHLLRRYLTRQTDALLTKLGIGRKADNDFLAQLLMIDITADKDSVLKIVMDQLDDIIDWSTEATDLKRAMRSIWQNAYNAGASAAADVYKIDGIQQPQLTRRLLEHGADRVKSITDTTRTELAKALTNGVVEGDSQGQLTQRVLDKMPEISERRASTIAANEVHTSLMSGNFEMLEAAGYQTKTWLTSGDADVRSTHAGLNNTTIPIDEKFDNGLLYPGDPAGPPNETIGCRCDIIAGEPLEKPTTDDQTAVMASSNFFNRNLHGDENDELVYHNSRQVKPEPGYYDVFIHGDAHGFQVHGANGDVIDYTPAQLSDILLKSAAFQARTDRNVRLLACDAGREPDGAAQQLADILGVEVKAPNRILRTTPKGKIFIQDDMRDSTTKGDWVIFKPRR